MQSIARDSQCGLILKRFHWRRLQSIWSRVGLCDCGGFAMALRWLCTGFATDLWWVYDRLQWLAMACDWRFGMRRICDALQRICVIDSRFWCLLAFGVHLVHFRCIRGGFGNGTTPGKKNRGNQTPVSKHDLRSPLILVWEIENFQMIGKLDIVSESEIQFAREIWKNFRNW